MEARPRGSRTWPRQSLQRPVTVTLMFTVDGEGRVVGSAEAPGQVPVPFDGWLALMAELNRRAVEA